MGDLVGLLASHRANLATGALNSSVALTLKVRKLGISICTVVVGDVLADPFKGEEDAVATKRPVDDNMVFAVVLEFIKDIFWWSAGLNLDRSHDL